MLWPLLLAAAPLSSSAEHSASESLTRRDRLYDVVFVGREAWVVGFPGVIRHTRDGGASFEAQRGGGREALFSVAFVGRERGWIVGGGGLILHTPDGGRSWRRQPSPTKQQLFAVDFLDAKEGWAVGSFGAVLHTRDGGRSWAERRVRLQAASAPASEPAGSDAKKEKKKDKDEDLGKGAWGGDDNPYGVDGQGEDKRDGPKAADSDAPAFDRHHSSVRALGPGRAIAAGESGKIVATADGGASWQERQSGVWAPLYDLLFVTPERGFASGGVGTLLETADGGASWRRVAVGQRVDLLGLALAGGRLHAVGRRGTLLRQGAGSAFTAAGVGGYGWLSALAFGDGGAALIVGGQGRILRSTDGGASWRSIGAE
jgi:photosystem II stability/assembly factor-like uncharacterized protein